MKKSKTTKTTKKSYSSVKELLEDNNSKIKLTPFSCKEAKFGKIIVMPNPYCSNQKFNIIFSRASTSSKFFENIENRIPNQILWNEEEQQAYFLNSDKQLYKILFEPFIMKKKNTTQTYDDIVWEEKRNILEKIHLKDKIRNIAIPWSKFHNPSPNLFDRTYDTKLLTPMLIDLLDLVKENKIKVRCGVAMMQLLSYYTNYSLCAQKIHMGGCEIATELDFNLAKYDMWYDDVILVGKGVPEPNIDYSPCNSNEAFKEVAEKVCPPKKNIWQRIFG